MCGEGLAPHNTRPKTVSFSIVIPFFDDSGLLSYFRMTENGHKIVVNKHYVITLNTPKTIYSNLLLG